MIVSRMNVVLISQGLEVRGWTQKKEPLQYGELFLVRVKQRTVGCSKDLVPEPECPLIILQEARKVLREKKEMDETHSQLVKILSTKAQALMALSLLKKLKEIEIN